MSSTLREVSVLRPESPGANEQLKIDAIAQPPTNSANLAVPAKSPIAGPKTIKLPGPTSSTKADRREFFLPVSGFVWLFPEEVEVVNHPAFQRLGKIFQLGQSYFVFRGATHKRIEHVLGAVHVVQRMISAVATNSQKGETNDNDLAPALNQEEERFVRLGTLLHDIGHIVAGHTVEDELNLIPKHDEDQRLDLVLTTIRDRNNQTLEEVINHHFARYVPTKLQKDGLTPTELARLLVRKTPKSDSPKEHASSDPYEKQKSILEKSSEIRMQVCRDMIGDTICADLLDYIHRDWYHIGKPRPFDERLLQYMEIRRGTKSNNDAPSPTDVFVISLGRRPKLRTDAVSNILELLEWRYQLAETVLFHRTKLAAAAMLDRALFELWGDEGDTGRIVKELLELGDEEMLTSLADYAEKMAKEAREQDKRGRAEVAAKLLRQLERRELFKNLSTRFFGDLPGDVRVKAQKIYGKDESHPGQPARNRNKVVRMLEEDFDLPAGSIALYCPAGVNKKIAEVKIWVNGEIEKFCDYEEIHQEQLAGGHLAAQLRRFDRLWRLHFVMDPAVKNSLGERLYLLQQAVEKLAIGILVDEEDFEHVGWSLAKALVQVDDSPWENEQVAETVDASANASAARGEYPTEAPSIRNFFVPKS